MAAPKGLFLRDINGCCIKTVDGCYIRLALSLGAEKPVRNERVDDTIIREDDEILTFIMAFMETAA
jgi:hypothetical protein